MQRRKPKSATVAVLFTGLMLLAVPALSDTRACATKQVSVTYHDPDTADLVCQAVERTTSLFERCNIPSITESITIDIVEDVGPSCVGVYHCGEHYIELLSPRVLQDRRDTQGAFGHLELSAYFQSIVAHELAHAATDDVPCPFDNCVVTSEYIAYVLQVMFLTEEDQRGFEEVAGLDKKISSQELVPIILYMAPDLFAQKAWTHFTQRDDPYGYISQLVSGEVRLDHETFHRD